MKFIVSEIVSFSIQTIDTINFINFRELIEHGNVTFNENGTLSTTPLHPLEWQPHLSYPHTEDDMVILPNIAYLVSTTFHNTMKIFP